MSTQVYFGWNIPASAGRNAHTSYRPQYEDMARIYSVMLDERVSPRDVDIYIEVSLKEKACGMDFDSAMAWRKMLESHPLHRVMNEIGGRRLAGELRVHLPLDEQGDHVGSVSDKDVIEYTLISLGLNGDAASLIDCIYWC